MARNRALIYKTYQFSSHRPADWAREFAAVAGTLPRALHVRTGAVQIHEAIQAAEYDVVEDPRLKTEFWFAYKDKQR